MPGFVPVQTRNHAMLVTTTTRFCGWRLVHGIYVRGIDVAIGGEIGAAGVNALSGLHYRAAIGRTEPDTELRFSEMEIQLVSPNVLTWATDQMIFVNAHRFFIGVDMEIVDTRNLVLAVALQSQTDVTVHLGLMLGERTG